MGADEPADASASGQPASTKSPASNGGGSAKKRLLPMELRRRRRAAKLQITSEKNVATISANDMIESIQEKQELDDAPSNEPAPTTDSQPQADADAVPEVADVVPPQSVTSIELHASTTTVEQEPTRVGPTCGEIVAPTATSTAKRLQNLFSFSLLDRKRQKLHHRDSMVEVPTYMKVNRMPLDITPKSKAVISMSFQFPFIRPRASSLASAMSGQVSHAPEVKWLQALQYYAHPASALPSSLNATNERQLEESEFYVARFRVWQDSFRQAYFGFRRLSRNGTLYVQYPEFMACFYIDDGKATEGDNSPSIVDLCRRFVLDRDEQDGGAMPRQQTKRLRAVISQSNARLRKELHRRGVEFHVPFNLRAWQKPAANLNLNDDDLTDHAVAASSTDQSVHGPDSLLQFSGHQAVHGLFEYLLNRKPLSNQDVPEILAHHPFANAVIRSIAVRYMGKTSARDVGDDASASGRISSMRSEVELSGFCYPSAIERLINCLEESQKEEASHSSVGGVVVKAALETAPMSERLNAVFLDDKNAVATGLSRDGHERDARKQELDFAKRRLQSVKRTGGSALEIEMTAR